MLTQHIALVPATDGVDLSELARVSAALQTQVTRDLASVWGVTATIAWFPTSEDIPVGYWPILVAPGELGGHAGVHIDRNGVPYAQISTSMPRWSIDASRACLELLVNPVELRSVTVPSPRADQSAVELLVEVCGPCADERFGYYVNDILVSDFCTPAFFTSIAADGGIRDILRGSQGLRSSFAGALSAPLQILPGGHLAWHDPAADQWWVRSHWGENAIDTKLGAIDRKVVSVRELINACAPPRRDSIAGRAQRVESAREQHAAQSAALRTEHLRQLASARFESDFDAAFDLLSLHELSAQALDAASNEPAARPSRSVPPPLPTSIPPVQISLPPRAREPSASPTLRPFVYGVATALAAAALLALAFQSGRGHSARDPIAKAAQPTAAEVTTALEAATAPASLHADTSASAPAPEVKAAPVVQTASTSTPALDANAHSAHHARAKKIEGAADISAAPSAPSASASVPGVPAAAIASNVAPAKPAAPSLDDLIESRK